MSKIQSAILAAMADIAKTGIGKHSFADTGGAKFNFRGIEAAMNEMSLVMIRCGITVTPKYTELTILDREKEQKGKFSRFVTVKGIFTFSADDGSSVTSEYYGEAQDSGDKATTKAQSVAFRTALFQQFVVPTVALDPEGGGDDGDPPENQLLLEGQEAAMNGLKALTAWWSSLNKNDRADLQKEYPTLRHAAEAADRGQHRG